MKTAPLEKPSSKGREAKEGECGNKPCQDGSREREPEAAAGSGPWLWAGGRADPTVAPGMQQQGIVSLWPLEHGAVGTSQQVQAGQGVCGTGTGWWW